MGVVQKQSIKQASKLPDTRGSKYRETSCSSVSLPSDADVVEFKKAVKAKNEEILSTVDSPELKVYRIKASLVNKEILEKDWK